jgi:hypothetical protein
MASRTFGCFLKMTFAFSSSFECSDELTENLTHERLLTGIEGEHSFEEFFSNHLLIADFADCTE